MSRKGGGTYEQLNLRFRSARVYTVQTTKEERQQIREVHGQYNAEYNVLQANCVTPIYQTLQAGDIVDIGAPLRPENLAEALEQSSRISGQRTVYSFQPRQGGAPWRPKFPSP